MAALDHALGLVTAMGAASQGAITAHAAETALPFFQQALNADPMNVMAALNLTEVLVALQQDRRAVEQARQALAVLDRQQALRAHGLDAGHFPPAFDHFRVEWERAAWTHAGCPAAEVRAKQDLVRWRLHTLLAGLTGALSHFYEAVLSRPDLPLTRAALGCALGRQGHPLEALGHLRGALAGNPFDHGAARALYQALGEVADTEGQQRLADDRRLLARAAPLLVPREPWFKEETRGGD
jgi:tetratricopeptide (TPR) repeat protein